MQERDEEKGDGGGHVVDDRLRRDAGGPEDRRQDVRKGRLAHPPESEAGEGDSQLGGRQEVLQALLVAADGPGAPVAGLDQLLDPGVPHPGHRELRRGEEPVQEDQPDGNRNRQGVWQNSQREPALLAW